jgi:hypothetical protein
MHCDRKLDRAETCAGVSAYARGRLQNELAHLICDFLQIFKL